MALTWKKLLGAGLIGLVASQYAVAKDGWEVSLHTGTSFSKNETLNIHYNGTGGDIYIPDADLETRPFTTPFFYGLRVGKWTDNTAWEFEHIHQKIYLKEATEDLYPTLDNFEITDGYNLFYFNRAWNLEEYGIITRVGLGFVVVHPDITIDGIRYHKEGGGAVPLIWQTDSGYQWAGYSAQVAVEKEFQIYDNWYLSLEGKLTHSSADIDIEDPDTDVKMGSFDLPNTAIHLMVGVTYHFGN
ncbi:MAG: hypothetical protein IE885_01770 [Campylobacterales bacterium]|nr:hypothetical protein [Campylobacterales bacterium]